MPPRITFPLLLGNRIFLEHHVVGAPLHDGGGGDEGDLRLVLELRKELRRQILEGKIEAGQPLTEQSFASTLDTSRTPIREALRMLERDQLVERNHNKGFTVLGISEQDLQDIFELRAVMEGWAAGKAAVIISEENLKVMENCLTEAKALYQAGEIEQSDQQSNRIHDIIAFVVNNRWLSKMEEDLSTFTSAYKKLASDQAGQIEQAYEEHWQIFRITYVAVMFLW